MYRGTTPTFIFQLDSDTIDLSNMSQIWVTIRDGAGLKHNWDITSVTVDNTNKYVCLFLTQEETLTMEPGIGAAQIRFLTNGGIALTTEKVTLGISKTIRGGIIE